MAFLGEQVFERFQNPWPFDQFEIIYIDVTESTIMCLGFKFPGPEITILSDTEMNHSYPRFAGFPES